MIHDPTREESDDFSRLVLELFKAARVGGQVEFLRNLVGELTGGRLEGIRPLLMKSGGVFGEMVVYILKKGIEKGRLIGQIRTMEKFLDRSPVPEEHLEAANVAELERLCGELEREYERRFKNWESPRPAADRP